MVCHQTQVITNSVQIGDNAQSMLEYTVEIVYAKGLPKYFLLVYMYVCMWYSRLLMYLHEYHKVHSVYKWVVGSWMKFISYFTILKYLQWA